MSDPTVSPTSSSLVQDTSSSLVQDISHPSASSQTAVAALGGMGGGEGELIGVVGSSMQGGQSAPAMEGYLGVYVM